LGVRLHEQSQGFTSTGRLIDLRFIAPFVGKYSRSNTHGGVFLCDAGMSYA